MPIVTFSHVTSYLPNAIIILYKIRILRMINSMLNHVVIPLSPLCHGNIFQKLFWRYLQLLGRGEG